MQVTQALRQLRMDKAGEWMWRESGGTNEKYLNIQRETPFPVWERQDSQLQASCLLSLL